MDFGEFQLSFVLIADFGELIFVCFKVYVCMSVLASFNVDFHGRVYIYPLILVSFKLSIDFCELVLESL